VKGNLSGVYHDVASPYYDATHPEEGLPSAADAQETGYRAPKRWATESQVGSYYTN
jgi:hypothetical protein